MEGDGVCDAGGERGERGLGGFGGGVVDGRPGPVHHVLDRTRRRFVRVREGRGATAAPAGEEIEREMVGEGEDPCGGDRPETVGAKGVRHGEHKGGRADEH